MNISARQLLNHCIIFLVLSLLILHPYTLYGKPGIIIAFVLIIYGLLHGVKKQFATSFLVPGMILLTISIIGVISSVYNDIFQLNHFFNVFSLLIMFFAAYGFWAFCHTQKISTNNVIKMVLFVIVLNSIIIMVEVNLPSIRLFIESFLDPLEASSINYSKGYRLRGLASAGGAMLSISVPMAITLALYLVDRKALSIFLFFPIIIALLFSILVIGRTGLVLLIIPIVNYLLMIFKRKHFFRKIVIWLLCIPIALLLLQFIVPYLLDLFGEKFIRYAGGFLFEGKAGIDEEGTARTIAGFLTVLPLEFPQSVFGYGFYGGSNFYPWTDSGYARIFLSVGFIFGFIHYLVVFKTFSLALQNHKFLIITLIMVLAIAEIKEPLLCSGVASRMFVIILVFIRMEHFFALSSPRSSRRVVPHSRISRPMAQFTPRYHS